MSNIGGITKTNTQLPCWATNSYFTVSQCFGCALWAEIFFLGNTQPSWKTMEIPGVGWSKTKVPTVGRGGTVWIFSGTTHDNILLHELAADFFNLQPIKYIS